MWQQQSNNWALLLIDTLFAQLILLHCAAKVRNETKLTDAALRANGRLWAILKVNHALGRKNGIAEFLTFVRHEFCAFFIQVP